MKMLKIMLCILVLILLAIAASVGVIMSDVEQAKYTIVTNYGDVEIREYEPMVVAVVEVSGPRKDAISSGFRLIANYIFGNNQKSQKIAMTAPVMQELNNQKVIPTAVVEKNPIWKVQFVMPRPYDLSELPKPINEAVELKNAPAKRFVVIRFSGVGSQSKLDKKQKELEYFIQAHGLVSIGNPIYAFFNPPWTLPFLRRNEIMIEIKK